MSDHHDKRLLVQTYLKNHSFNDLARDHGVYARIHDITRQGNPLANDYKASLNYDQIEAKDNDKLAQQCRGLVLRSANASSLTMDSVVGDTIVLARGFDRFFNLGQETAANVDFTHEDTCFYEKHDGCLHEDTVIITNLGNKTIKELCETKLNCKVLSVDVNTNTEEWVDVEDFLIQENNHNWYELELETGETVKLTGNHLVWCCNLNCYRRTDELTGSETVYLKK